MPRGRAADESRRREAGPDKRLLSARDLRKALGVSAGTLYRWRGDGTFPPQIRISANGAGWKESDLNRWVADPAGWRQRSFNELDYLNDF